MPHSQTHTLSPRAAARPRCPKCQSRTEVQRTTAARTGFEHWTLRCIKCGLIHEAQINADPMKSDFYRLERHPLHLANLVITAFQRDNTYPVPKTPINTVDEMN